jgi:O-antigen ligase
LAFLPFPASRGGVNLSAFDSRFAASDAAVSSRWNLLPVLGQAIAAHPIGGSGFGATVTYRSDDPRIISIYPGGLITTGAIEWQYLEIWLKLGLPGLLAFGWLIVAALRFFWTAWIKNQNDGLDVPAATFLSFVAFVVLNVFTPYWNHPLGWMYLALLAASLGFPESSRPASDGR